jgi:hypothetical protein
MSDFRDIASNHRAVLKNIDSKKMTGTFSDEDEEGNEVEHTLRLKFEVCDTCEGRGVYVNPSIDSNGLTREDFDQDPDFAEDYFSGRYDITCAVCKGLRVEPVVDEANNPKALVERYQDLEADSWAYARELAHERDMGY